MRAWRLKNLDEQRERGRQKYARERTDPNTVARRNEMARAARLRKLADPDRADCSVDGCDRVSATAGLCDMHYLRFVRKGDVGDASPKLRHGDPDSRFWPRVDKREADECWPWTGAKIARGYGRFNYLGKSYPAYRFAWESVNGPVPDGLELDHLCRNPSCCNPAHLEPVTHAENMRRIRKDTCPKGHPLTPENTWVRKTGARSCAICGKTQNDAAHARRKAARGG